MEHAKVYAYISSSVGAPSSASLLPDEGHGKPYIGAGPLMETTLIPTAANYLVQRKKTILKPKYYNDLVGYSIPYSCYDTSFNACN